MNELVNWDEKARDIDAAKDLSTIARMHAEIGAIETLARQSRQIDGSVKVVNKAVEYKFYLEQNAGKMYAGLDDEKSGDFQSLPKVTTETQKQQAQKEIGKTRKTLSKWVEEGEVGKATVKEFIAKCNDEGQEASTRGILRFAKEKEQPIPIETPPLPDDKYSVIVIDPPWQIEKIQREVRPNQLIMDYPMMDLNKIRELDVIGMTQEKALLFMWTIEKYL